MNIQKSILIAVGLFVFGCGSDNRSAETSDIVSSNRDTHNGDTSSMGAFEFQDTTFDFGNIKDGERVQHVFTFKNIGKGPMSIKNVQAMCGCTTPEWTREVIPPGGEGRIVATFNSTGRGGPDNPLVEKSVEVFFDNSIRDYINLTFVSHIYSEKDNY